MVGGTDDGDGVETPAWSGGVESTIGRRILPGFIRRRYAAKFFLSLLVVVIIIAGVGVVSFVQIQGIIEDDAENTLRSTAILQADSVSEWTGSMRVQTRAAASSDVFASGDSRRIRTYLTESKRAIGGDIVDLHYVDPSTDTIVVSTNEVYEGKRPAAISPALNEPIAKAVNDTTTVGMSDSAYERGGSLNMAFASSVRGSDGVVVLVGDVARDFEQLHKTRSVVTTRILNANGKEVLAPRSNNPTSISETTAFRDALAGNTTTVDRGTHVVALSPVDNSEWVITTTAPKSELYRASNTVGRNVIILVTVSIVALGVVGIILGRQTVLPLVRLRERTQAMEAGDLDVDLTTDREDEIGRLFDSFGNMRDALRNQIEAAERAREEAEASRQELARQNERLDHFASTVSHDLRNPLTVARGNLELLAEQIDQASDESISATDIDTTKQLLDRVDSAHERIDSIIDDVLTLARGGKHIEEMTINDLATVAEDAWGTVDTGDATLTITGSRDIEADEDRLRRALENLFRNTIDHVGTSATIEIGLTETGFYVADDGPGIPAGEVDAIFDYGHTTADSGTGLGLSIVETIAEAHEWDIKLDTDYSGGARFVFSGAFEDDQGS